jgi:hypothetical protein
MGAVTMSRMNPKGIEEVSKRVGIVQSSDVKSFRREGFPNEPYINVSILEADGKLVSTLHMSLELSDKSLAIAWDISSNLLLRNEVLLECNACSTSVGSLHLI